MNSRLDILKGLLSFSRPLNLISQELRQIGWDCESPCVIFESSYATNVLERFLMDNLSAGSLEHWANLIEGREDVEYEEGKEELLGELIFRLANPVLAGQITRSVCTELIDRLNH